MKSIEKLVRELDIPELSADAWNNEMKKVEWRFMLEHRIPPTKITNAIQNNLVPHSLGEDWIRLMAVKPFIPGL